MKCRRRPDDIARWVQLAHNDLLARLPDPFTIEDWSRAATAQVNEDIERMKNGEMSKILPVVTNWKSHRR